MSIGTVLLASVSVSSAAGSGGSWRRNGGVMLCPGENVETLHYSVLKQVPTLNLNLLINSCY